MLRCRLRFPFVLAFLISGFPLAQGEASDKYTFAHTEGQNLDIVTPAGQTILRYVYVRDTSNNQRTFETSKVFAHVMAPDGKATLTKGNGGLYPHHRGIFIGWNKLQHSGKTHDLWHTRDTAQLHQKFLDMKADEIGASITSIISWIGVANAPVIEEQRTYRVIRQDDAYVLIDFLSELTAVNGNVTLDGDPEHAGVQFRPSQQVAENNSATYFFHADGIDPRQQFDLPWVAATFRITEQLWTVQHMNHPSNPKGARWSAYRPYGRFGPFARVDLADQQSRAFRYRFRVTIGKAPPRAQLAEHHQRYAEKR